MVFRSNLDDLQKKKIFTEIRRVFPAEITNSKVFFWPKSGDLQKKRSSPTLGENQKTPLFWSLQWQVLYNFGSQIPLGELFSFLKQKSASKAQKKRAILHTFQTNGGRGARASPRLPPGSATERTVYLFLSGA